MPFSLRNLFRRALTSRRPASSRARVRPGLRLCVEELEGRITPSGPTVTMPANVTFSDDVSIGFSAANGTAITVADPSAVGPETVLLQVTFGTVYLATTAGLTGVSGNGTASIAMTGTLDRLNAALNGLTYLPEPLAMGDGFLSVTISDNASPTPRSGAASTSLSILPGNIPPTVNGPRTQQVYQLGGIFSTANGNAITVNDPDANGGDETVIVQAIYGAVAVQFTTGLTSASGNNTHMVTLVGPISALNGALNEIMYHPSGETPDYLNVLIIDNGNTGGVAKSAVLSMSLSVVDGVPAPVITIPTVQDFNAQGVTFSLANGNAIHLADSYLNATGATLYLQVAHGTLTVPTAGSSISGSGTSLVEINANMNGASVHSLSDINAAMDGLHYRPAANAPDDFLSVTLFFGPGSTTAGLALAFDSSSTLAPVLTAPGPQSVADGAVLVFSQANQNGFHLAAGDANGADEIVIIDVLNGRTRVPENIPGVAVSQNGTSSLLMTGTIADLNAALDGLQYGAPPGVTSDFMSIAFGNNGSAGGPTRYAFASLPITLT